MRKITKQAASALYHGFYFKESNTLVENVGICDKYVCSMFLHRNEIAKIENKQLKINTCGWKTNLTKERLNGVLYEFGFPCISQRKGIWYIGDKVIPHNQWIDPSQLSEI